MFTHADVQRISNTAGFAKSDDSNQVIAQLSHTERLALIKGSSHDLDVEHRKVAAAIEIQRLWRGYQTRCVMYAILFPLESERTSPVSQTYTSPVYSEVRASLNSSRLSTRISSGCSKKLSNVQLSYHNYTQEFMSNKHKQQEQLLTFQGFCAYVIQRWYRRVTQLRRNTALRAEQLESANQVPARCDDAVQPSVAQAVVIIQKSWRRHIDRQVFRYYRQLIMFKNKRDARHLLRCINPLEADLLDEASGVHVRFRLGGDRFPPSIYYKIFTHRNVADVGAFAPRTYTKAENKNIPGRYVHNRGIADDQLEPSGGVVGDSSPPPPADWYERHENNGWRLVNERFYPARHTDAIATATGMKKQSFSCDRIVRQQDVEKKRKQKKIDWMKKMYSSGMMQSKEEGVGDLVESAAKGLIITADQSGPEAVNDWEIDELLQWTEGLNFDNYVKDWHSWGTATVERDRLEQTSLFI